MVRKSAKKMRIVSFVMALAVFGSGCPVAMAEVHEETRDVSTQSASVLPPSLQTQPANLIDPTERAFVSRWLKSGQYLPTNEIKPGMQGYGLTVFQGNKVERFEVTVIGVVKKVLSGRDAILVRLSGTSMGKNTVIRGMSGSPVYIGGKLVGAISYGFDFSREPIVGITPIVDMLDALAASEGEPSEPSRISRIRLESESDIAQAKGMERSFASGGSPRLVPLMAPVALAGFSSRAETFLQDRFKQIGLAVSSGAAGALDETLIPRNPKKNSNGKGKLSQAVSLENANPDCIRPGSAVAVMLTTGDFSASATGTATTTFGGKVLAFGHPFLQAGPVDFPMATAFIHQVLPNLAVSFKVASPVRIVGSVVSDRPWSVGGQVGRFSKLIPATYSVTDRTRKVKRTYKCQVVNHPDLTPDLLAATAMSAIDATHQSSAPYVVQVESTIDTDKAGQIHRHDQFSSNFTPHTTSELAKLFRPGGDSVGSFLKHTADRVINNDFEKAAVKSVNMDIVLEDGHKTARLERIYVDKPVVEPGETVNVHCLLRPYNEPKVVRTLSLKVPRDVPDGNILIGVAAGDQIDSLRKRMGLSDPTPENLSQVAERIREAGRGDAIEAVMALPEQSLFLSGKRIVGPPAHWLKLFFSDRHTRGPALVKGEVRARSVENWLVDGNHLMTVEVRREDKTLAHSTPYTVTPFGAHGPTDGIYMTETARKTLESSRKTDASQISSSIQINIGGASASPSSTPETKTQSVSTAQPWNPAKSYPHMRSLLAWRQSTEDDFKNGKSSECTIDSRGRLSPGFHEAAKSTLDTEQNIWSCVYAKDHFWFSAKDRLYKWKGDKGAPQLVAATGAAFVPAIAASSRGTIYAALVPNGTVVEISDDGTAHNTKSAKHPVVMKLDEPIITSLCVDDKDNLYAGVAGTGKVYKWDRSSNTMSTVFDSGQAHVTCLTFNKAERRIYVGTGEKGAVYSFSDKDSVKAEYQTADHIVTGAIKDASGNLYVTTAGQGHLLRVKPSGETDTLATSEAFYTLLYDPETDTAVAGDAEGDVTQAQKDKVSNTSYFVPVYHTEEEAVVAMAADGRGRLFVSTSNLPSVRLFEMRPSSKATYSSPIRDAQRPAQWSKLRAFNNLSVMDEAMIRALRVETRTGNTSQPDSSWSNWTDCEAQSDGFAIKSPPGRFFQYRIAWKQESRAQAASSKNIASNGEPPTVRKVEVTYLPTNATPYMSNISLVAGSHLSGKQDVSVTGADPDQDNLLFSLEISADGGKTWKKLATDIRSKKADVIAKAKSNTGSKKAKEESDEDGKSPDREAAKKTDSDAKEAASDVKSSSSDKSKDDAQDEKSKITPGGKASDKSDCRDDEEGEKSSGKKEAKKTSHNDTAHKATADMARAKPKPKADNHAPDTEKTKTEPQADSATKAAQAKTAVKPPSPAKIGAAQSESQDATEKFTYEWDTSKFKDGTYMVKLVVSDRLSNPDGFQQVERIGSVIIDNTPPKIESVVLTRGPSGENTLEVKVEDLLSPISNAIYRIEDGPSFALGGGAGATDSLAPSLKAEVKFMEKGANKVVVEVSDLAGNTTTKTVSLSAK